MVKVLSLNNKLIELTSYQEEKLYHLHKLTIQFHVTSEDYHDVTTLLYEGTFDVKVPEIDLQFKGSIQQYSTSVTNLYEKDQVGEFTLTLLEIETAD